MQKGKGKALRSFSLALFSLVLKQDSANRMEAYYTARHLWEEAAKRLNGQIKGQTKKRSPKPYGFRLLSVMRDQFRCMLKIGKIESWSGFELFQPYFLLTISRDREESRDF